MRSCWTTGLQAPQLSGFSDYFEERNSEVKLSWGAVKRTSVSVCGGKACAGEGGGLDQLPRVNRWRLICHYTINVMKATWHICISQIRRMIKTMPILIFIKNTHLNFHTLTFRLGKK